MKNAVLLLTLMISTFHLLKAQDTTNTECPTDIEVMESNSVLNVFPNPTDGTFQIVYLSVTKCPPAGWGGKLTVNIIDFNSKIIYTETIPEFEGEYNKTIDLSSREKGIYIVEI